MAYKIKSGFENCKVGARIYDGTRVFNGLLKDATQEELEELHILGIPYIVKSKTTKSKKKKRDNSPTKSEMTPPPNE